MRELGQGRTRWILTKRGFVLGKEWEHQLNRHHLIKIPSDHDVPASSIHGDLTTVRINRNCRFILRLENSPAGDILRYTILKSCCDLQRNRLPLMRENGESGFNLELLQSKIIGGRGISDPRPIGFVSNIPRRTLINPLFNSNGTRSR